MTSLQLPYWSAAADKRQGIGSEGMVSVWDDEGRYVGCMGINLWRALVQSQQATTAEDTRR